jgi:hypothetical protein
MRRTLVILAFLGIGGFVCQPAAAQLNTLYEQEGTVADGYPAIDASGQGPATDPNRSNWKYQYGDYSWSAVYSWDSNAWVEEQVGGTTDEKMEIECDIEMYCETAIADHKVYFHLGNLYAASEGDLTAQVTGSFTSNNGQWVGVSFDGTAKAAAPASYFEGYPENLTGRIFDGMVGTVDIGGRDISGESFDVQILLSYTGTGSSPGNVPPDTYGAGAHETIPNALWWLVNAGQPGSYNLTWHIKLFPEAHQADGNYHLDPAMVMAPVL